MASQIRPTRLDVTDRFPMLGFTILTDGPPRVGEVVLATHWSLFTKPEGRTPSTFYSSREHGLLTLPKREAVYVVPPEVLARFIAADQLWFGLATATPPTASDWVVDVLPTESSPYVSLASLSDRALRRVRMFPTRGAAGGYAGGARATVFDWAGDRATPGSTPAPGAATQPAASGPTPSSSGNDAAPAVAPGNVPYDDGFGPLPPLNAGTSSQPSAPQPSAPSSPVPVAQSYARGFEVDPETMGIEEPVFDELVAPQAMALGTRPRALTSAEYSGVTRIMPSPAYNNGRRGQTIDRIVIHITGAPQSPHIGSWFAREEANSSAHYMVDQGGEIIQFVREQDIAWHARGANGRSIGIEHVAIQQGGARYPRRDGTIQTYPNTAPTDAEYRASAGLVAHLCRKYGLTPDRTTIIGHREADTRTTHTSCPDGAWDWEAYMALVAECYAALPATGVGYSLARTMNVDPESMGIEGPAYSEAGTTQAASLALTAKDYDRASRIAPSPAFTAGRSQTIDRIVIHITDAPTTGSTVNHFTRGDANSSAHYLVGQDGEVVQLVSEADTAWHARGVNSRSVGIEHVAVKQGGATYGSTTFPYMPPTDTQYCESAALVSYLCEKYGLTPDRTTIIGHAEADPNTTHTTCPDGAWDWTHFMDLVSNQYCAPQPALAQSRAYSRASSWSGPRAMSGGDTVEIKYRVFIPSPLIKGPLSDYDLGPIASGEDFSGDGRTFSYNSGTSRGEITATLTLGADGGISNLRTVNRHWGDSKAYDSTYTYHVDGKPDWWMDKQAGHTPSRHATLAADDDNLKIYQGASGTTRNILAMTSQSAVVSIYLSGSLPLVSPSPAIDADIAIYLKRGANGVEAMVVGDHDGFPCHELYINGQLIFGYDPVAAGNDPTNLLPPTDREVSTSWIAVPSAAPVAAQGLGARRQVANAMVVGAEDRQKIRDKRAHEWKDLFQWNFRAHAKPEVVRELAARGFTDQTIDAAAGDLNLDFYKVEITRFPPGWDGPRLLAEFIHNINNFIDSDLCSFNPYSAGDATRLQSANPLGAVLNLDINSDAFFFDPRGWDDAAIVISDVQPQFYSVTTITTPDTGEHPVSGHRQFGWFTESGKTYFYTRGADRATTAPPGLQNMVYAGGHALWESFQRIVANFLKLMGGEARVVPPFSERFNPTAIREELGGLDAVRSLGLSVRAQPRPRALAAGDWSVNWDEVFVVPQPTDMSCWATAAAMIIGWRDRQSVSPELLAQCNGLGGSITSGLAPSDKRAFADALGLVVHPNACYTPEGFRDIIEANGPVWVTAKVPGVHAIVVTGMYSENGGHFVRISDPWDRIVGSPGAPGAYAATHSTGSQYIMSYDAFSAEFEAAGDIDRIQLLHTGGTHDHVVNRGNASAAGYAQALNGDAIGTAPVAAPAPPPVLAPTGDASLGVGTSLTRQTSGKNGRSYDLAQLSGMVLPANALDGGAGTPALAGERVVLDDWPYIDGPSGRTQAGVAIDWKYQGGAVGQIAVAPIEGQVLDGWSAAVKADIGPNGSAPERTHLKVRVTTTFSCAGQEDQVAVTDVILMGDGRQQTRHGADRAPVEPLPEQPVTVEAQRLLQRA